MAILLFIFENKQVINGCLQGFGNVMCQFKRGIVVSFFDEKNGFSSDSYLFCKVFLSEVIACSEFFNMCFHTYFPFQYRYKYDTINTNAETSTTIAETSPPSSSYPEETSKNSGAKTALQIAAINP